MNNILHPLGGHIAGSLAVVTDAAHLLTDLTSFLLSLFSLWLSSKPPSKRLTFGWHRAGTVYGLSIRGTVVPQSPIKEKNKRDKAKLCSKIPQRHISLVHGIKQTWMWERVPNVNSVKSQANHASSTPMGQQELMYHFGNHPSPTVSACGDSHDITHSLSYSASERIWDKAPTILQRTSYWGVRNRK